MNVLILRHFLSFYEKNKNRPIFVGKQWWGEVGVG